MAASDEEQKAEVDHLNDLLRTLQQRKRLLERQQAVYGVDAPGWVTIQLDRTLSEIELTEARLRFLSIDPKVLEVAGEHGIWQALSLRQQRFERDIRKALSAVHEELANYGESIAQILDSQRQASAWRQQQDEARATGQDERRAEQRRVRRALLALAVVGLVNAGLIIALLAIVLTLVHAGMVAWGR